MSDVNQSNNQPEVADDTNTKDVTLEEYRQMPRSTPIIGAKAVVDVFDKDGKKKATLQFSTDALEDADDANN